MALERIAAKPPMPRLPEPQAQATFSTLWFGKKISGRELHDLNKCILSDHSGPDVVMMQSQMAGGRVDATKLEASWGGSFNRERILRWLSEQFNRYELKDEWFLATVALLDRAEVAWPCLSHRKALYVDALAIALATFKLQEVEAVFEPKHTLQDLVRELGSCLKLCFKDLWKDIIQTELRLCQALDFHVCKPAVDELAVRIALDIILRAGEVCPDWEGLQHVRLSVPGQEPSLPIASFIFVLRYIVELNVIHAPGVVYQEGSPSIAPLAAVHLALCSSYMGDEAFYSVPPELLTVLKGQQARLLQVGEEDQVLETLQGMYQLWCALPHDSEVVRKWSSRISDSEDENVVGVTALLEPTEGLVMTLQGPVSAFPEPPETRITPEKDSKLNLKDVSMDLNTPFSQASTAAPPPSASPSAYPASSLVGRNAFAMPDISVPMSLEDGKLWAGVDSGSPVEQACLEIPSEVPVPGAAKTYESHGTGACIASKSCKVPKALKVKTVAKCSRTTHPLRTMHKKEKRGAHDNEKRIILSGNSVHRSIPSTFLNLNLRKQFMGELGSRISA